MHATLIIHNHIKIILRCRLLAGGNWVKDTFRLRVLVTVLYPKALYLPWSEVFAPTKASQPVLGQTWQIYIDSIIFPKRLFPCFYSNIPVKLYFFSSGNNFSSSKILKFVTAYSISFLSPYSICFPAANSLDLVESKRCSV